MMIRNVDRQFAASKQHKERVHKLEWGLTQNKKTLDHKNASNSIPFIPMCIRSTQFSSCFEA
jgi:hypothetical protein